MPKRSYLSHNFFNIPIEHGFTWYQTYAVKRSHPASLFMDTVGLIWFTYFFWAHNWQLGLGIYLLMRLLSSFATLDCDTENLSQTTIGKIALLHLNPANFIIQVVGLVVTYYGVWQHSVVNILIGISAILVGHVFGWEKVDARFKREA
jgi:hypothetical protein